MPTIKIDGVDRTQYYEAGSLDVQSVLNEASVGSFRLVRLPAQSEYHPAVGESIEVLQDGTQIIAGSVDEAIEQPPMGGSKNVVDYRVIIGSEEYDGQRRIIRSRAWENVTVDQIVQDIIDEYLSDEGISAGSLESGQTVDEYKVQFQKVGSVLNDLASKSGKRWVINPDDTLDLFSFDTTPAPWDLKPANFQTKKIEQGTFEVSRNRDQYTNRVYARGGEGVGLPRTETFTWPPDDQVLFQGFVQTISRDFILDHPIEEILWIRVNNEIDSSGGRSSRPTWFAKTGLGGTAVVDVERPKYTWKPGFKQVGVTYKFWDQFSDGDAIDIRYLPRARIAVVANNATQQRDRRGVEGGTGLYEDVIETQIRDRQELKDLAIGRLQRRDQIGKDVQYITRDPNLKVGMKQAVDLPRHNLTTDLIITGIDTRDPNEPANNLRRHVRLVDESALLGYEDSFASDSAQDRGSDPFGGLDQDNEMAITPPGETGLGGDSTSTETDIDLEVAPTTENQVWVYENNGASIDTISLYEPGGNKVVEFDVTSVFSASSPDDRGDILAVLDPGPSGNKELVMISPDPSDAASAVRANIEDPTNPIFIAREPITGSWSSGFQAPNEPNTTTSPGKTAFGRDGKIYVTYGAGSSGQDWLTDPAQKEVDVVDPASGGWTVSNAYQRISVDESSLDDPFGLSDEFGGIFDLNTIYHCVNWFGDAAIYSQPWGGGTPSQFKGAGSLNAWRGYVMSSDVLWIVNGNTDTTLLGFSGWSSVDASDPGGSADTNISLNGHSAFTPNEERKPSS